MGKLAEIKTKETSSSVEDFINNIKDEQKRQDSFVILKLMQKISREKPKMWGSSIIGFGKTIYKSPTSGREVEWFKIGFSPRKANISLYLFLYKKVHGPSLKKLGKHKTGLGCLYINKLGDIDLRVLEEMMHATIKAK
jgi:Domain of unknown function (DU1801)